MRRLVITQNITVAGSIEMLGDWFDPQGGDDTADVQEAMHRHAATADGFLAGRQSEH